MELLESGKYGPLDQDLGDVTNTKFHWMFFLLFFVTFVFLYHE